MLRKIVVLGGILSTQLLQGSLVQVFSLAGLGANDSVNWSQLGADGSTIGTSFSATSVGGVSVTGGLSGNDSLTSVVCPAGSCSWAAGNGFNSGDTLVWTSTANNSTGTHGNGPLVLTTGTSLLGAGLLIESDGSSPGTFTAELDAYDVSNHLLGSFFNTSTGASGNAVFLGITDTTREIAKLVFSMSACTLQNCSDTSFAVDSLALVTPTPEPSSIVLFAGGLIFLIIWHKRAATVLLPAIIVLSANAQQDGLKTLNIPTPLPVIDGTPVAKGLTKITFTGVNGGPTPGLMSHAVVATPPALPLWTYQFSSPKDGHNYTITMVGQSPFNKGARTVKVPVVIIPLIIKMTFGTTNITYDPTVGDVGCLGAGNTALGLTQNSPIFSNYPFSFGPTSLGTTQYPDAFLRGQFWTSVSASGGAYHMLLSPVTTAATQTLSFSNNYASGSNAATYQLGGQCGSTPFAQGSTNPGGGAAVININIIDPLLQVLISNLGITANQFPLFVIYNSFMTDGPVTDGNSLTNCCILGYHNAEGTNAVPGQTYGIADFEGRNQTLFGGTSDVSVMSHEVNEWVNDPGASNPTPGWGGVGQVASGCANTFEVGDPLSGKLEPNATLSGFTYHLQELAFFSWFYGGPSLGTNGWFSSNNTFTGVSKVCPPGGTN